METIMHDPFIYFLCERNQVFVYKIQNFDYVTLTNVMEKGEWKGYELQPSEPFTAFRHEGRNPKEGWSFWVAPDQLSDMVDIINDYIQQQRKCVTMTNAQKVHIVCSESAAGSLRVALAPPKYVIGFPEDLSIGPLWKLDERRGQVFRHEWLIENINDEMDDFVGHTKLINVIREIRDIPMHLPIYIWYGNNTEEQCGLRFFLFLLREHPNDIFLIDTADQHAINRQWNPDLYEVKQLSVKEHQMLLQQWESLMQSKEIFRQWQHQHVQTVPENYYDSFIVTTLEQLHREQGNIDFIQTGTFLLELLTRMEAPPNIFYLEYRVRYLVYNGFFALKGIPKTMRHYYVKIRQKTSLV
ncbi:DUF1835 domain-containing protein [Lysinibacillus sp. ZYM-1]|uniref:DUF1835 domain-containing protein n=1 Tax=Lysinibacillus sp. ZYM-1 TaxID=1681184 RepID=UPI0006CE7E34|nr:DUF1835 domain-containing protein [Lysinibacillus sp. ZYM-1]KPN98019.1 hypothetical protein AO843_09940 [Lysinibacillus sp. ZYM-1]